MKRANESIEQGGENSDLKKVKILNESDESSNVSDRNEGVVGGSSLEIEQRESLRDDTSRDVIGNVMSPDHLDDTRGLSICEEKQKHFTFDLNFPPDECEVEGERIEGSMPNEGKKLSIIGSLGIVVGSNNTNGKSKMMAVDEMGFSELHIIAETIDILSSEEDNEPITVEEPAARAEAAMPQPEASPQRSESPERAPILDEYDTRHREREQAEELKRKRYRLQKAEELARANSTVRRETDEVSSQNQHPATALTDVELLGTSPGPFSEALKLVRERAPKRASQQLIEWTPSRDNSKKWTVTVPSLLNLSLKTLAENAEAIVSLKLVPNLLCRRLIDILCDNRKMNMKILSLVLEQCPTEMCVKNCSWLNDKQFEDVCSIFQTRSLKVLQFDLCGQCMLDYAFRASSNRFSNLTIVSLRGACRLSDDGLKNLVKSAPALQSINVGQCCLLTNDSMNFLANWVGQNLRELYIDECQSIDAWSTLPAFENLKLLEVLSIARMRTVTDSYISEMVIVCGHSIKELDIADCIRVTDRAIESIGHLCPNLLSLNISDLNLTDRALEYLANGCKSIQKLKICRNTFSDEAVAAFLECAGKSLVKLSLNKVTKVGPQTALSLARQSKKLQTLDLSWCRKITDDALGLIVDSCSSLKLLKIFGCRQITKAFLNGHSNQNMRILGLDSTPLQDHFDVLGTHDVYLRYSPLPDGCMDN